MKRFGLFIMLLALLLTGCTESEPATVATISPGPVSVTVSTVDGEAVSGNGRLSY